MKVLVLSSSYLPKLNGVTRTVSTLSEGLAKRGNAVVVVTKWRKGLPRETQSGLISVVRLGKGRGFGESAFFWGAMTLFVIRSCMRKQFQIVHAHGTISGLSAVCGWLMGGVPFVVSFHQDALIGWETGYNRLHGFKYHIGRLLQSRICRFAAVVTVQSPRVKEITKRVLGLNGHVRMVVVPNPVDIARFSVDESPPHGRNVLFVGNLIKRKAVDVLLRAVAILVESVPDARLTIVGRGPEKASLISLAKELGISVDVSFVDEVDDKSLASLYRSAAVVVLPSYSEVFGVVILEALASNRPVVATDTVGAHSILVDKVSGRVVPIGDSMRIAEAIADIFSDDEASIEMVKVGHQLVASKFSTEAVTEELEQLYRSATPPLRLGDVD